MRAVTLFGNLQSFMGQALDQAVATQALWHTLSSRLRVSLGPGGGQQRGFHVGHGDRAAGWLELLAARCFPISREGWWRNEVLQAIFFYLLSSSWAGPAWLWGR